MPLTRRQFLRLSGVSTLGAVAFVACGVRDNELLVESPVNLPEDLATGSENWYATLCTQCASSCGAVVRVMEGRAKKIEGNPDFPMNRGKHSARCEAALQALYHPNRLRTPLRRVGERGAGQFEQISWNQALAELTGRLELARGGSFVLATGPMSGHLGLVARRFAESLGGRHLAYEPVEQTVLRRAIKEVLGQDQLPDFDIEHTEFLLSFGADFLSTWLSPVRYARGYGEFRQGREGVVPATRKRGTHVHVDPRFSMTAANADEWVWLRPGTEGVLALSLAYVIIQEQLADAATVHALTGGEGLARLGDFTPARASQITGVPQGRIEELARAFAGYRPSLAIGGGSAAAHTNGLFNLKAIYALNYLVGSVGKIAGEGGIVFNPPPLLDDISVVTPAPFKDWQELLKGLSQVKVLMVRDADLVHGLASLKSDAALNRDDLYLVSVSSILDDTAAYADLVLPEHASLEDWGDAVPEAGPGHQVYAMQQPVVRPRFETLGFGDLLLAVDKGLGGQVATELGAATFKDLLANGVRQLYQHSKRDASLPDWQVTSAERFWTKVLQHGGWWDARATSANVAPPPPLLPPQGETEPRYSDTGAEGEGPFYLVPFEHNSLGDGRGAYLPWLQAAPDPVTTVTWSESI